jgi:antitoxin component YwqK of YwqJK toxin-antitoxin module
MTTYLDTVPFDCWFSVARWCDAPTLEALTKTTKRFKRGFVDDDVLDKWDHAAKRTVKEEYHENGKLRQRTPWVDGEKHGVEEAWHENGQLSVRAPFAHGQLHGTLEMWDTFGKQTMHIPFVNGQLHGACMIPWVNGENHGAEEM